MEVCRTTGIAQPKISKFLTGRIKSITPDIAAVLDHANIEFITGIDHLLLNHDIRSALADAWDGTKEGADLLAKTIRALAPVVRRSTLKASTTRRIRR